MQDNKLPIGTSLSRAFGKVKPDRKIFEAFKINLRRLLEQTETNETESEEFHKNLISDFLKNTYYSPSYFINTKGRNDLVIHTGKNAQSSVGVILEVKRPTNKGEMLKVETLNSKAFQELVLYFLRERLTGKNLGIRYLIATNIYEWFIFDAKIFEELFAQDKALVKQFADFEAKKLSGDKTNFFYKDIAKPAIGNAIDRIKFTHFDIRDYKEVLENGKQNDQGLVDLYKVFSPQHLLKLDFANDSNSLNKPFYNELLYIIGLTETKEGGKKLINRKKEGDRDGGSLLENAINRLDSLDRIPQLRNLTNPEEFGETDAEKLFNVALRLSINWINRVLFLKLLEAQLIKYHQGDRNFAFLNLAKVKDYQALDGLFFEVLAREQEARDEDVREMFANVPYLNSSLFEQTEVEQNTITIGALKGRSLPIFGASVLTDRDGKRRSGSLDALSYLFEFLAAYDFSSDELTEGQEDSEKLINAAVLGLIFEKINGYKDGSFFTPSFITMYMCRETIRRAIVQKFNEVKGWDCENLEQLDGKISDKKEANVIINSLKVCDPAVGSGHFLVSALNEIIAIKSELRVLLDRNGKSLRDYRVEVRNDKLIVYDDEGKTFDYRPKSAEKQRVQEALFHEKQTIIESCLFGVDINPNSVTICRLRLWIELLKNAYYKENGNLETLPNIDINIKCGNSLISRFGLNSDVSQALKKQKFSIEQYRNAVQTYRNAESRAQKRDMERLIAKIKDGFSSVLLAGDPKKIKLRQLRAELFNIENQLLLLEETKAEVRLREKTVNKLNNEVDKLTVEIEDIESGKIYNNALEWRFEFPEVLNDQGDFIGFDSIIGNPPYIRQEEIKELKPTLQQNYQCYTGVADLFVYFYELGLSLLKAKGHLTYISSNKYFRAGYGEKLRQFLGDLTTIHNLIDFGDYPVFEEAIAYPSIITLSKARSENNQVQALSWNETKKRDIAQFAAVLEQDGLTISQDDLKPDGWRLEASENLDLLAKLRSAGKPLEEYVNGKLYYGIKTGFNEAFVIDRATRNKLIKEHSSSAKVIKPFLRGRDVKRWCVDFADQYLIKIESSENKKHPWTNKSEQEAEQIFNKKYPAIYKYFEQFRTQLIARSDQGRFFWELRSCKYWQEFQQPKIIYPNICRRNEFAWDELGYYTNQKAFIIPCNDKVLLAVLNSSVVMFLFENLLSKLQGDFYEPSSVFMKDFPIPTATGSQRTAIEKLVQRCLDAKKGDSKADTSELEKECDRLVYKLYELTEEEIKIIEGER